MMRVVEKTAEAVVAKKAGNAAGAKGRRTKYKELEEELDIGAISDSNHRRNNYGSQPFGARQLDLIQGARPTLWFGPSCALSRI